MKAYRGRKILEMVQDRGKSKDQDELQGEPAHSKPVNSKLLDIDTRNQNEEEQEESEGPVSKSRKLTTNRRESEESEVTAEQMEVYEEMKDLSIDLSDGMTDSTFHPSDQEVNSLDSDITVDHCIPNAMAELQNNQISEPGTFIIQVNDQPCSPSEAVTTLDPNTSDALAELQNNQLSESGTYIIQVNDQPCSPSEAVTTLDPNTSDALAELQNNQLSEPDTYIIQVNDQPCSPSEAVTTLDPNTSDALAELQNNQLSEPGTYIIQVNDQPCSPSESVITVDLNTPGAYPEFQNNLQNELGTSNNGKRWRKCNPEIWQINKEKKKRSNLMPYVSQNNKKNMPAKMPKNIDCTNCTYKCTNNFTDEQRIHLCRVYWSMKYDRQKDFILSNVKSAPPKSRRPRTANPKSRQDCKQYYFFKSNNEQVRVCAKFFLSTLCISNKSILSAFKNKNEHNLFDGIDGRGRQASCNKTSEVDKKKVTEHIRSFPCVESHYTRKSTKRQYLDPTLSITKMYSLYKMLCEERNDIPVSATVYRRIFCTEFNLSFFVPKKDQCIKCNTYKHATTEEKELLEDDYNNHQMRKTQAHNAKALAKLRSAENPTFMSVSFDLEAILQIPKCNVSILYYKRKLTLYNLAIYENKPPNKGFCYFWTEIEGKKGSCEIATCVYNYLCQLPTSIKSVALFSDTCGGQNRNAQMAAMMMYTVQNTHIHTITHNFLESGHSYMEADSMHSAIEKQSKHMDVFSTHEWMAIFKNARSNRVRNQNKPPYEAVQLSHENFYNFKKLASNLLKNKKFDTDKVKCNWLLIKSLRFEKNRPCEFLFKYNYNEQYKVINILGNRTSRKKQTQLVPTCYSEVLSKCYSDMLPIIEKKKKDLVELCDEKVIPLELHPFFKSLPTTRRRNDVIISSSSESDSD